MACMGPQLYDKQYMLLWLKPMCSRGNGCTSCLGTHAGGGLRAGPTHTLFPSMANDLQSHYRNRKHSRPTHSSFLPCFPIFLLASLNFPIFPKTAICPVPAAHLREAIKISHPSRLPGVTFQSNQCTTKPNGSLFFHMLSALAMPCPGPGAPCHFSRFCSHSFSFVSHVFYAATIVSFLQVKPP